MGRNQVKARRHRLWRAADTWGCHVLRLWERSDAATDKQGTESKEKQCYTQTEDKEGIHGAHKMSNFEMSIFIIVLLISTKSYSFFFLLLFTKENVMEMDKNEKFVLCAVYNARYLPGSTKTL